MAEGIALKWGQYSCAINYPRDSLSSCIAHTCAHYICTWVVQLSVATNRPKNCSIKRRSEWSSRSCQFPDCSCGLSSGWCMVPDTSSAWTAVTLVQCYDVSSKIFYWGPKPSRVFYQRWCSRRVEGEKSDRTSVVPDGCITSSGEKKDFQ